MSSASIARALAWKESRGIATSLLATAAVAAGITFVVPEAWRGRWIEALLLFIAPLCAAGAGAEALAPERLEKTLGYLLARPVGFRTILGWKLAVHGGAAALCFAVLLLVAVVAPGPLPAWSELLDAPAKAAWLLAATLAACAFLWAFACSLHLPDALTACPAGLLMAIGWTFLVMAPALVLGRSAEVALEALCLALPMLLGGSALAAWLSARLLGLGPAVRLRGSMRAALLACSIVALGAAFAGLHEPRMTARIRAGRAVVAEQPVLEHPIAAAVAFTAAPEGGRPRAVLAWLDSPDGGQELQVLAPGTRPLGWLPRGRGLAVQWPDGTRRVVSLSAARRTVALGAEPLGNGPQVQRLGVEAGQLVRRGPSGSDVVYPMTSGGAR